MYGTSAEVTRPRTSFDVPFPKGAELTKTEIYIVQGQYSLGFNGQAAVACHTGT